MELTYDWKNFQSFFYTKKRLAAPEVTGPIYVVLNEKTIVAAFAEGEDLSEWIGSTHDEMVAEFSHREFVVYDRDKVDQWMDGMAEFPHSYDQIHYLRTEAKPQLITRNRFKNPEALMQKQHFLLQAIQSWWGKFFPSTYGIYLRLEGTQTNSLLIIVKRGKLESFHVPDVSSMIPDRRKVPNDVVKFLSEKYLVPVQGLFVTAAEWNEWSESPQPWPKIIASLKANRNKMAPFRWSLASLIAMRGYLGF
jgi:hypothetical protein